MWKTLLFSSFTAILQHFFHHLPSPSFVHSQTCRKAIFLLGPVTSHLSPLTSDTLIHCNYCLQWILLKRNFMYICPLPSWKWSFYFSFKYYIVTFFFLWQDFSSSATMARPWTLLAGQMSVAPCAPAPHLGHDNENITHLWHTPWGALVSVLPWIENHWPIVTHILSLFFSSFASYMLVFLKLCLNTGKFTYYLYALAYRYAFMCQKTPWVLGILPTGLQDIS